MKRRFHHFTLVAIITFLATLCAGTPTVKKLTFTGEVGDAMCGAKHMQGTPAECTRTCVAQGSKYALVVGDKVYKIETGDKQILDLLNQQAGKNVTVTGTLEGDTITAATAVAAK
jgi:hypothetical protein